MKKKGLHRATRFAIISDEELDVLAKHFKEQKPDSGLRYFRGYLSGHGIWVQVNRARLALQRVDGLGQVLRTHRPIDRQQYSVPAANCLWHLDGHHKLIRWGFVIHGIIDGYDHVVSTYYATPMLLIF
jgi:hypothetical protein